MSNAHVSKAPRAGQREGQVKGGAADAPMADRVGATLHRWQCAMPTRHVRVPAARWRGDCPLGAMPVSRRVTRPKTVRRRPAPSWFHLVRPRRLCNLLDKQTINIAPRANRARFM